MKTIEIRPAIRSDFDSILHLNYSEVEHTSPMDRERLNYLDTISCYHKVVCINNCVGAFLLAMNQDASYCNDNFSWFTSRYEQFIYVDRIVVSKSHAGLGLGSTLYDDLFQYARTQQIPLVTCEYNIVPANEPSRRFHDKFGFNEVGTQWVAGGSKQVSLQAVKI